MNMKHRTTTLITTVLLLLPLACSAAEGPLKPLWDIQARLGGEASPAFFRSAKELLGADELKQILGDDTTLRVSGFVNTETPEKDWIAELRGLREMDGLIPPDGENDGIAVWSDGEATLKAAMPATSKGISLEEMSPLKGNAWFSGWIDFDQIQAADVESTLLKLSRNLSFTFAGTGDEVTLDLNWSFSSPEIAQAVVRLLGHLRTTLDSLDANSMIPPFVCKSENAAVVIRMNFKEADMERLLNRVIMEVGTPAEEN
ncbi:MAG: hypothetical protein ACK56K_11235 [Akkermansiaceae bacterium]|jgi:hypothetical protein